VKDAEVVYFEDQEVFVSSSWLWSWRPGYESWSSWKPQVSHREGSQY